MSHVWLDAHPVLAFEKARAAALVGSHFEELLPLLSLDLRYTHATGVTHNYEEYLRYLQGGIRFEAVELSQARVLDSESVAVVVGNLRLRFQRPADAQAQEACSKVTQVWLRSGAVWKLSVFQSTREQTA